MGVAKARLSGDYSHLSVIVISLIKRMHIIHAWTTKFCSDDWALNPGGSVTDGAPYPTLMWEIQATNHRTKLIFMYEM